ncbi:hypothetical protein ERO13_A09G067850v2 [Gossypium hirsutum]|nr:hypothetical protein ERO13_A09G067850v2 [Gossypium hirsutum]
MAAAENNGESNKSVASMSQGPHKKIIHSPQCLEPLSSLPSSLPSLMLSLPYSSSSNASLLSLRLVFPFAFNATQNLIYYRPSP